MTSDVYLLILGGRYGSIEPKSGKSYTHLEYDYAVDNGKAYFAVVIEESALNAKFKRHGRSVIEEDNAKALKAFRDLVSGKLVKFWSDKKDIELAIHKTLSDFARRDGLVGWVRAIEP